MKYLLSLFLFFLLCYAQGQTKVKVHDKAGNPISGRIIFDALSQSAKLDERGEASILKGISEVPDNIELLSNDTFEFASATYDPTTSTLDVLARPITRRFQIAIFDASGDLIRANVAVSLQEFPNLGTQVTDETGIMIWRIPKSYDIKSQGLHIKVGSVIASEKNLTSTGDGFNLKLDPKVIFTVRDAATQKPLANKVILVRGEMFDSDNKGTFSHFDLKYKNEDIEVEGCKLVGIKKSDTGLDILVEVTEPDASITLDSGTEVEMIEEFDTVTVDVSRDLGRVLDELDNQKLYLIESSTKLRTEMEYLQRKLASDNLTPEQQKNLEKLLNQVSDELINNELEYQDIQHRTRLIVDEMKRDLSLKDSLNEATSEQLQQTIEEEKRQEAQNRRNLIISGGIITAVLIFAFILLFFARKLQRQRNDLSRISRTLEDKVSELDEERKKVSARNAEITSQNAKIVDSIRYAQTIQASILPSENQMKRLLKDFFVIFKPKDIVSGDFYWFSHLFGNDGKGRSFMAIVDCTGHGVPGAFMSIVGNDLLNEIISQNGVHEPSRILDLLNKGVKKRFRQSEYLNNDSMDVALCAIEKHDKQFVLTFSGAKLPLYYFNAEKQSLEKIRGGLKSVGGRHKKDPDYPSIKIGMKDGDAVYITSDGFPDQNDSNNQKIGMKGLQDKILQIADQPMADQKEELENMLSNHQGKQEQRDDITVIGIRF
ncbi:MAG: SpoIIE family protein phosphatase [Bacteroidota bacterium]